MPGKHLQRGGINTIKRYYRETLYFLTSGHLVQPHNMTKIEV